VNGHCLDHGVTTPCGLCSADHLAGAHLFGSHETTCARCAIPPRGITAPAQPDLQHLAAGDDSLTDTEETP